jgi:nitroimidazol reductase NimA-like FMN-containing flavoprotein (pyridoxamine 5'-phosphate oxidase superfamily)
MMAEARRSVRMTDDEAWQMLEQSVNGILTTLRRDGRPVALPIWYVVLDRRIYIGTRGKKVVRARHDPRCSFLVEAGERWADLRAVHVDGLVTVIDPDPALAQRIADAMAAKYAAYRSAATAMPAATREHYTQSDRATLELVPEGKLLTWDNRHLGLG